MENFNKVDIKALRHTQKMSAAKSKCDDTLSKLEENLVYKKDNSMSLPQMHPLSEVRNNHNFEVRPVAK